MQSKPDLTGGTPGDRVTWFVLPALAFLEPQNSPPLTACRAEPLGAPKAARTPCVQAHALPFPLIPVLPEAHTLERTPLAQLPPKVLC